MHTHKLDNSACGSFLIYIFITYQKKKKKKQARQNGPMRFLYLRLISLTLVLMLEKTRPQV